MSQVIIVHVEEVDGSGHSFTVEPGRSSDIGTQSRQIYERGATEQFGDGEWAYWPPHRIVKIEVRNAE